MKAATTRSSIPVSSRSPTGAARPIRPICTGRTPCTPSPRPSALATAISRPTCMPPPTACCWPSTTRAGPGQRPEGQIGDLRTRPVADARIGGVDPIPTLGELFEAFPEARFNIDAKADDRGRPAAEQIAEHDAYDRVCVSSFGVRRLRRAAAPARAAGPLVGQRGRRRALRFLPWLTRALQTPAAHCRCRSTRTILGLRVQVLTPQWSGRRTAPGNRSTSGPSTTPKS